MPIRSIGKGLGMGAGLAVGQELVGSFLGRNNRQGGNMLSPNQAAVPVAGGVACGCGFINEAGKKFCNSCGTPIVAPPAANNISSITCSCGTVVSADKKFCNECGSKIEPPAERACSGCNLKVTDASKFCNECGSAITDVQQSSNCKSCNADLVPGIKFCNQCGTMVI